MVKQTIQTSELRVGKISSMCEGLSVRLGDVFGDAIGPRGGGDAMNVFSL